MNKRKKPDLNGKIHHYHGKRIDVSFSLKRCTHVGVCLNGDPRVFSSIRRPWIMPDLAEPDDVAEIILRCPTGALHFERTDGGAQEPIPESNRIEIKRNGPFNVSGDTILMDEEGEVLLKDNRISLCRCGKSKNKPLCDGRHFNAGFHHPGIIRDPEKSLRSKRPCKLIVSIQKYGPYLVDGPFELFDGEGHSIFRDRGSLCACGKSKTKPFCDGSHKRRWFFSKRNVRAKRKNSEVTA